MTIYSVHDVLANTWSFPQVSPTKASAARDFAALRTRPNVPGKDLECVLIGFWDPEKGNLSAQEHEILVPAANTEKLPDEV